MTTPAPPSRPRWYHPTPGRALVGLLAVEGLLMASERFRWFGFNEHKGWTVLIAVAVVAVALLLMAVWFPVSLLLRRPFRFSLRSLLLLVVVVAVPCSWLAAEMEKAREQRALFGSPRWRLRTCETPSSPYSVFVYDGDRRTSNWLEGILGVDFFKDIVDVLFVMHAAPGPGSAEPAQCYYRDVVDAELAELAESLPRLEHLSLRNQQGITDAGLEYVKGMSSLRELDLINTQVTGVGVKRLRQALPNCRILWDPPARDKRQSQTAPDQPGG